MTAHKPDDRVVVPLTETRDPVAAAADWMVRIDAGLDAASAEALEAWLDASPIHRQALEDVSRTWDRLESLKVLADLFPLPQPASRQLLWRPRLAVAAAALFALGVFFFADEVSRLLEPAIPSLTMNENVPATEVSRFETPVGGRSTAVLSDGSTLTLNTGTRVHTRFSAAEREIHLLAGEIHLDVTHEPRRPLRVYIGERRVEAVGTAFNVHMRDQNSVEVIVTEGTVLVSSATTQIGNVRRSSRQSPTPTAIPVTAGQRALIEENVGPVENVPSEQLEAATSWMQGHLIFRGEPLQTVLEEVSRYTALQFEIRDEAARSTRVVGLYRAGDIDPLLESLRANFNVDYERQRDGTLIVFTRPEVPAG